MSTTFRYHLCCALSATFLPAAALAQATPSPGDIQRQVEPTQPSVLPGLQVRPGRLTQPSQPAAGAATSAEHVKVVVASIMQP